MKLKKIEVRWDENHRKKIHEISKWMLDLKK